MYMAPPVMNHAFRQADCAMSSSKPSGGPQGGTPDAMKYWRADIDQHGTVITLGIFDAVSHAAASKLFADLVTWATVMSVYEVDPHEVARIRSPMEQPHQLVLQGI